MLKRFRDDSSSSSSDTESTESESESSAESTKDELEDLWTPVKPDKELAALLLHHRYPLRNREKRKRQKRKKRRKLITRDAPPVRNWKELMALLAALEKLPTNQTFVHCQPLRKCKDVLLEIDRNVVGMPQIKDSIAKRVIRMCQKRYRRLGMEHTLLMGPSGTGKTTICRLMGRLFSRLGVLKSEKVVIGTRHNMIAGYVGQTSKKTQKVINDSAGGILLLDEVYQFSPRDGQFDQDFATTLVQNMSERDDLWVIACGYEEAIKTKFLPLNEGFARRFKWQMKMPKYTPQHLHEIFRRKMDLEHGFDVKMSESWFANKMDRFPHFGGSVSNLVDMVVSEYSLETFGKRAQPPINMETVTRGYQLYLQNQEHKEPNHKHLSMYI